MDIRNFFSAKRAAPSGAAAGGPAGKRARGNPDPNGDAAADAVAGADPDAAAAAEREGRPPLRSVACWNVNGLHHRLKTDADRIRAWLSEQSPDVLFLSEVKYRCRNESARGALSARDKKSAEEADLVTTAFQSDGCFAGYKALWSLADTRYAGTAMLLKRRGPAPVRVHYSLAAFAESRARGGGQARAGAHDPEGRVIVAEFSDPPVALVHTYTPNNGTKAESYARRRLWDDRVRAALRSAGGGVVYCGDLNVAPCDLDLSHPAWMKQQCAAADGDEGNAGQPGCTMHEQRRFRLLLEEAALVDAYRALHPRGAGEGGREGAHFTWRGRPGRDVAEAGRFFGKGMRIDHVLVSGDVMDAVETVDICGTGRSCADPSFLGSDHCPMILRFRGGAAGRGAR